MQYRPTSTKILTREQIAQQLRQLRRRSEKIVFTNGCFDLLHAGHVRYLQEARQLGDCLVVAINSDHQITSLKGPGRPVLRENERARILASLACVDYLCVFSEPTPHELLRMFKPDLLVKGGDYGVDGVIGRELVWEYGGEVRTLQMTPGISTTQILGKITGQA